jgi:hypothetical protein
MSGRRLKREGRRRFAAHCDGLTVYGAGTRSGWLLPQALKNHGTLMSRDNRLPYFD